MAGHGLTDSVARCADMLSAMGTEPRLRIMRLLLSAYPDGLVVGEIGNDLGIPGPTLSHHLEKLKNEDLVTVRREGTFLRYSANAEALRQLLAFLYAECCSRSKAVEPDAIIGCSSGAAGRGSTRKDAGPCRTSRTS
jgi:ArsR family transcriptional regulator, arsenate/arsenite/antimonite-responsive transcriptional repressor